MKISNERLKEIVQTVSTKQLLSQDQIEVALREMSDENDLISAHELSIAVFGLMKDYVARFVYSVLKEIFVESNSEIDSDIS